MMETVIPISYFENIRKASVTSDLLTVLYEIKAGKYKEDILQLRALILKNNEALTSVFKKNLPAFTPCGLFANGRKKDKLSSYNRLQILDIDKVKGITIEELKAKVTANEYVFACFISPSGNGLKILVRSDNTIEDHETAFTLCADYFEKLINHPVDRSGKDVSRLCFVSFDENTFINMYAKLFALEVDVKTEVITQIQEFENQYLQCKRYTNNKVIFEKGNRNNFIYLLACNCNRAGIPFELCRQFIFNDYNYDRSEVESTLKSAYKNIAQHDLNAKLKGTAKKINSIKDYLAKNYCFRYNAVTNTIEFKEISNSSFKEISDTDENNLFLELNSAGINCNLLLLRSILNSKFSEYYNPFEEYFYNLPEWDAETDYIKQLADTVITSNQEFWHIAFKKWLVAMVKCLLEEKEINHTVIIFTGEQGLGKTTWLLNLVPEPLRKYRFSGTISVSNKDTLVHMSECMLINLDELETLNKSEIGEMKELITKGTIRQRLPYARNNSSLIRRSSFVGSVNNGQFLTDITGNRRFLCFQALSINYLHKIDL